jgi:molybdenum cofactor cytidylyltransferase
VCGAVADAALAAGCRPILVAGYRATELVTAFAGRPEIMVAVNADWERGMLGSVVLGASLADGPGFLVAPADMPLLRPEFFRALIKEAGSRAEAGLPPAAIFAAHGGKLGHPVWIPSKFREPLLRLPADARIRDFLLTQAWISVEAGSADVLLDLDEPGEYRKALAERG